MSADPSLLHPQLREWCVYLSGVAGARVTSTLRPRWEQESLYRRRQKVLSGELPFSAQPYPVAPPGTSKHEKGLAWDMRIGDPGTPPGPAELRVLAALGRYWNSIGGTWDPSDPIHFQA